MDRNEDRDTELAMFGKGSKLHNSPYCTVRINYDIAWRKSHQRYTLIAPLPDESNGMQILKTLHTPPVVVLSNQCVSRTASIRMGLKRSRWLRYVLYTVL